MENGVGIVRTIKLGTLLKIGILKNLTKKLG